MSEHDKKEQYKRVNIKLAITYFTILILIQILVFYLVVLYGLNIYTLLLIVISTTLLPVILGLVLIRIFKKMAPE